MSYDLMAFEASRAPRTRRRFLKWYEEQTEWNEDHGYDDPIVSSPGLRAMYEELVKTYPNMNKTELLDDSLMEADRDLEAHLTDYSIGRDVIYACFSWGQCEDAYELMSSLCRKYGLGFFDVSRPAGEIFLPDGSRMEDDS